MAGYGQDAPLRARSVCLQQRPRSTRPRHARSAEPARGPRRYPCAPVAPVTTARPETFRLSDKTVRTGRKRPPLKTPYNVSVQTLVVPLHQPDSSSAPVLARPSGRARVVPACAFRGAARSHTQNRLLRQISEAEQVADFERILATNAILRERVRPEAAAGPRGRARPPSAYSLSAVTRLYHSLFAQHEHALRPLAERHRVDSPAPAPAPRVPSVLDARWFHELTDLAQFYDEDEVLHDRLHALRIGAAPTCTLHGVTAASSFGTYCHEFASNITSKTVEESGPTAVEEEWPDMSACPGECVSDETPHATRAALSRTAGPAPAASSSSASADAGRAPRDVGLVIRLAMPSTAESPTPAV